MLSKALFVISNNKTQASLTQISHIQITIFIHEAYNTAQNNKLSIHTCHLGFTNQQLKSLINSTSLYNSNCDDETSSQNFTKQPDGYPSNLTLV